MSSAASPATYRPSSPRGPVADVKLYVTVRGSRYDGLYHPDRLPRRLPSITDVLNPSSKIQMPPQRMLTRVYYHRRWLECLTAAKQCDVDTPQKNREPRPGTPTPVLRGVPVPWCSEFYIRDTSYYRLYTFTIDI